MRRVWLDHGPGRSGTRQVSVAIRLSDYRWSVASAREPPFGAAHERELTAVAVVHNQVLCIAALFGLEPLGPGLPGSGWPQPRR
jgi:hypothetical protein